ncbi:hypothetical protein [Roseovarius sp. D0-M9]
MSFKDLSKKTADVANSQTDAAAAKKTGEDTAKAKNTAPAAAPASGAKAT